MAQAADGTQEEAIAACRWRLNRAGIVNVYQYGNEVLNFAGGRLLLRGVNGSGKSTAMNMLLPFLLTTREGRIDAAGEQSGILKSWMLSGRDDAQPVGYLWVEFEREGEFLVCGCGIKANRQSERVSTWWFLTSKRPGIDLDLVSGGMALSSEALRAALDGGEVFSERNRRDYRRSVEQRLFGGASIDQHVSLLNKVRSPRVGDRIDLDLRDYLVDALPPISERALTEAAQPLDDLEEHRRSVAALAATLDAIRGLLDVYGSYCQSDLRRRINEGLRQLAARRDSGRDEQKRRRAAEAATAEIARLDAELDDLAGQERRLRREIDALVKSSAYERGQQLEDLHKFVRDLAEQCEAATNRVGAAERRAEEDTGELDGARRTVRSDRDALNAALATAGELAHRCGLDRRPPGPLALAEADECNSAGSDRADPPLFDVTPVEHQLDVAVAALARRRADIEQVRDALSAEQSAERRSEQSESTHNQATAAAGQASARLVENTRRADAAKNEWAEAIRRWAAATQGLLDSAGLDAPGAAAASQAGSEPRAGDQDPATGDPDALSSRLYAEVEALVDHWSRAAGAVEARLAREQEAETEAEELVDELARRTEPAAPRLNWQSETDYCLADLVDFAPGLDDSQRAGLEAALQSSGLLSARLADGATELEVGELAAVASHGVASPLSELLTVTVPPRLQGEVDEGSIRKLLESISYDPSSDAAALASLDGAFRVGSLRGAHRKERAEHIGSTARLAALEKARAEARARLDQTSEAVRLSRGELAGHQRSQQSAQRQRSMLPTTEAILSARAGIDAATAALDEALARRHEAAREEAEAERALTRASDALHRTATTLSLPRESEGLAAFERDLVETGSTLQQCLSQLGALRRSVQEWRRACARWRAAVGALEDERVELRQRQSRHDDEQATLATLEDSIGAEYAEVVADLDRCRAELGAAEANEPRLRGERDAAFERKAGAQAAAKAAVERREQAERACEATRISLDEALATPGYLAAVRAVAGNTETEAADEPTTDTSANAGTEMARPGADGAVAADGGAVAVIAAAAGSVGLRQMLDALVPLVLPDIAEVQPDSVHQSLRRRRADLGQGWDAEARQPDQAMPLQVEVSGPLGTATLADSVRAVSQQHQQVSGLLSRKQDEALRELLQGLIASEIAKRIFESKRLVEHMNRRLEEVTTAHRVGVRLRWRSSREMDDATERMVALLSKKPDLRTDDEGQELRRALSGRLDDARAEQPDVPYRQLIADTLDYKQWHEMAVMVRKGSAETRLSRSTPLSEGEKKLVTYLPLFAAARASYDALAEQQAAPGEHAGIARFVLLDDAFAKVSEDNHAALFGLLVQLDLDFIATSERLWGTHETVPALAVTEVIRDAALCTILLEHYEWDGATLRREDSP